MNFLPLQLFELVKWQELLERTSVFGGATHWAVRRLCEGMPVGWRKPIFCYLLDQQKPLLICLSPPSAQLPPGGWHSHISPGSQPGRASLWSPCIYFCPFQNKMLKLFFSGASHCTFNKSLTYFHGFQGLEIWPLSTSPRLSCICSSPQSTLIAPQELSPHSTSSSGHHSIPGLYLWFPWSCLFLDDSFPPWDLFDKSLCTISIRRPFCNAVSLLQFMMDWL